MLNRTKTGLTRIAGGLHDTVWRDLPLAMHHIVFSILIEMETEFHLINHWIQLINHPIHLEEGLNLMQLRLSPGSEKSHQGPSLQPL